MINLESSQLWALDPEPETLFSKMASLGIQSSIQTPMVMLSKLMSETIRRVDLE